MNQFLKCSKHRYTGRSPGDSLREEPYVTATIKGITMRQYCLVAIERELAKDEAKGAKAFLLEKRP